MRKPVVICSIAFSVALLAGLAVTPFVKAQPELPSDKLVNTVRLINTQQYSYQHENGRFAGREEMLGYLHNKKISDESSIDLENNSSFELAIVTSADGKHYQIAIKPTYEKNDKNTWCSRAAFSDEGGVIFLGSPIDCQD